MNVVRSWYVRLIGWNVPHVPRCLMSAPYSDPISFEISEGTSMKKFIFLKTEKNDVKGNAF